MPAARHHRAQGIRAPHPSTRVFRQPDRAGQPARLHGAPGTRNPPRRSERLAARGAVPRPRPLQEHQRHARPRRRRRRAAAGGGTAAHDHPPGRHRVARHQRPGWRRVRPPGRRRVHRGAAADRACRGCAADRRSHPPQHERALPGRRPEPEPDHQHRHRRVPRRRQRRGHAGQARRHRDVRRQGQRPRRLPLLQPHADRRGRASRRTRGRPAPRARARRVRGDVPAPGGRAQRAHHRGRSPGALASARRRPGAADGIHPLCRGVRTDRRHRHAGAAACLSRCRGVDGARPGAACGGEPVVDAVQRQRPARHRARRAGYEWAAGRPPRTRDHRERADGR